MRTSTRYFCPFKLKTTRFPLRKLADGYRAFTSAGVSHSAARTSASQEDSGPRTSAWPSPKCARTPLFTKRTDCADPPGISLRGNYLVPILGTVNADEREVNSFVSRRGRPNCPGVSSTQGWCSQHCPAGWRVEPSREFLIRLSSSRRGWARRREGRGRAPNPRGAAP